ncbi:MULTISPECIES: maleylpyruvate isomerase family mycothiol-dependent enzyme [Tsukamurella]|uniref:Maleylpyruvate isomerase family mycothiol-dependent enzyme n=2 Tax=Tsukamurella TaxID=2060 RepID=A0A5C5S3E0_9ACTN|nr:MULTISPECIES: maleylpyruvate isomerase family mycothiol-dependent enzyme [Tsukamurella]NMD54846.1 maleylpyruvate isomerase family mycothiol-dependent enzyme [Tsukamurella columbiensis]TWS29614.1 maleylpyruvate isomerase family mycothiol-dependent enzyme [Tsukamurella conjunctivitidis]
MTVLTDTDLYDATVAERTRMAALLGGLAPAQWAADSLCAGWRIREVVAHLNMTDTQTQEEFGAALAAAGGDVNVAVDRTARADVARYTDAELLAIQKARVASRWTPGPGATQGALAHEVIHGLDITLPLGLPGPAPEVLAATVAGSTPEGLAFFGVDLDGLRLTADDSDLVLGDGPTDVPLPTLTIVLIATGRHPVPTRDAVG